MKIDKCKTCEHYNSFFGSCGLYYEDVYLGEGDWEVHPVSIRSVSKLECEYEPMEAEEGKEINAELKAENKELKNCYKNNSALLDFEETNTTKLVNKVMKLEKTLIEIKEIAEKIANYYDGDEYELMRKDAEQILQKISEVTND